MFEMVRPLVPVNGPPPMYGPPMDPFRPPPMMERPMVEYYIRSVEFDNTVVPLRLDNDLAGEVLSTTRHSRSNLSQLVKVEVI